MSAVSNPALLQDNIHSQQCGSVTSGGDLNDQSHDMYESTANNETMTNNNGHISPDLSVAGREESPVVDIFINNVVCTFSTRCYLNLKKIAMEGAHVEYRRENGMLNMKLRRPNTTATIWSSGKITCTGSTSEDEAKLAARRTARRLQKLGFNIRFTNYRVVNVLGTCSLPFGIKLNQFSESNRESASYEPELHPGVTYRIKDPKATLKIFSTGSITVTAPSVANVQLAIEHIYPLVSQHKMDAVRVNRKALVPENKYLKNRAFIDFPVAYIAGDTDDEGDEYDDDDISVSFDSDVSQD